MSNYIYGSRLSYRDYLQAKSFEEAVRSEISEQTRSIIASVEQLREEHISLSQSVQSTVADGFAAVSAGLEELSFDLQTLNAGVSELTAAFHWWMSELLVAVGRVNDTLDDLVKLAKTPAQTWAYEQFEIARDAFRQELYDEALEYLNRAIVGYPLDSGSPNILWSASARFGVPIGHDRAVRRRLDRSGLLDEPVEEFAPAA